MIGKVDLQVLDLEQRRLGGARAPGAARRAPARRAGAARRDLLGEVAGRLAGRRRPGAAAAPPPAQSARSRPSAQRGWKGQPGGQVAPASAAGRGSGRAASPPRRCAACSAAARRCRGGAAARKISSTGPVSTMRPPYITATRWATSATTPRSWVMRITAAPVSAWRRASSGQHLRLHGDVEGGRRLVGDDELRPAGHRHGDHRALAHAAGELVRVLARRGPPGRRCRPRAGARRRAAGAWPRARRPCATWPSMIWRPTGRTGFSVVVGSWKTKPTSRPRIRRKRSGVGAGDLRARRGGSSRDTRAVSGSSPATASEVTLLPEPDSPTMPSTSFGIDVEARCPARPGPGRPDPTKVTSSARTDRTGSPPSRPRPAAGARPASSRLEPDRAGDQHVVDVEREAVDVLRRDDQARVVGVGRDARRPSRPAPG